MLWILLGLAATFCFGTANSFLRPIGDHLSPFFLQWLLGATFLFVNTIILVAGRSFRDGWIIWVSNKYIMCWSSGFAVLITLAFLFMLMAAEIPGASVSVLSSIVAVNNLVTFFWLSVLWGEYRMVRLEILIPGMLLCVAGVVLLAFAKRPIEPLHGTNHTVLHAT